MFAEFCGKIIDSIRDVCTFKVIGKEIMFENPEAYNIFRIELLTPEDLIASQVHKSMIEGETNHIFDLDLGDDHDSEVKCDEYLNGQCGLQALEMSARRYGRITMAVFYDAIAANNITQCKIISTHPVTGTTTLHMPPHSAFIGLTRNSTWFSLDELALS